MYKCFVQFDKETITTGGFPLKPETEGRRVGWIQILPAE